MISNHSFFHSNFFSLYVTQPASAGIFLYNNIMNRKDVKKILKSSCRGVLNDLLEDVGFTSDERALFISRYINDISLPLTCLNIHCGTNKYNYLHNNILDKIISHFNRNK